MARARTFAAQAPQLSQAGIYLCFLPRYSPELNAIEPVFTQIKHHDIPIRSHTGKTELRSSVEAGCEIRAPILEAEK